MTDSPKKLTDVQLDGRPDLRLSLEDLGINGAVILRIAGLIDADNSEFFQAQAARVIQAGARHLIIDASATIFMSNTGIGGFTALLKQVKEQDGEIIIYGLPLKTLQAFQQLGFTSMIKFCDTKEEATALIDQGDQS